MLERPASGRGATPGAGVGVGVGVTGAEVDGRLYSDGGGVMMIGRVEELVLVKIEPSETNVAMTEVRKAGTVPKLTTVRDAATVPAIAAELKRPDPAKPAPDMIRRILALKSRSFVIMFVSLDRRGPDACNAALS